MTKKLRTAALVARYDRSPKTIDRWAETGIIPRPKYINGYKFWDEAELDASDNARGQGTPRPPVAAGARPAPKSAAEGNEVDPIASAEQRKAENAELYPEDQVAAR